MKELGEGRKSMAGTKLAFSACETMVLVNVYDFLKP